MGAYLLDTNLISELVKSAPEPRVVRWVAQQAPAELHLAAVTLGELVCGATKLPIGRRRNELVRWIEVDLVRQFDGRILPFDQSAATVWGKIMGDGDRHGRPRASGDAQIAATAIRFDLTLATRNVGDFAGMTVRVINPWDTK